MASITVLPDDGRKILLNRFCNRESSDVEPLRKKASRLGGTSRWKFFLSLGSSASGTRHLLFSLFTSSGKLYHAHPHRDGNRPGLPAEVRPHKEKPCVIPEDR